MSRMLRRLLTFLALITGCAALYAPAQAASLSAASVTLQGEVAADVVVNRPEVAQTQRDAAAFRDGFHAPRTASNYAVVATPTIQLGPDRAHE